MKTKEFQSIEIDFDIHKAIERERRSFSETPNMVLRRLLGLLEPDEDLADQGPSEVDPPAKPSDWRSQGVTLPHGTLLQMKYNGRTYTGEVRDGAWHVEGQKFSSPSAAASGVAITKDGKLTSLDGWVYWFVRRPRDVSWTSIHQLRR